MGRLLLPNEHGGIWGPTAGRISILVWKSLTRMMVPQGPRGPEYAGEEEQQMLSSWVCAGARLLRCPTDLAGSRTATSLAKHQREGRNPVFLPSLRGKQRKWNNQSRRREPNVFL